MAQFFSAIMWRIDSILVALEGFELLGLKVKPELALEAFTKDSDNTEEHRAEQLHVQRGMGKNYERLEFIGDCFLKMATSITLFSANPEDNEFEYHVRRMVMICNKNLLHSAQAIKIHEYIRSMAFSRYVQTQVCYQKKSQLRGTMNIMSSTYSTWLSCTIIFVLLVVRLIGMWLACLQQTNFGSPKHLIRWTVVARRLRSLLIASPFL